MAAKQKVASLAELLTFLIQRGVVSGRKKIELVELCELAKEVSLVFDPDGLFEDREEVDEVNQVLTINVWLEQEWEDERLVWNPDDYNGLETLRIPCDKVWLPDIVLYNSADDFTTGYMKSKAMVSSNGNVFWPPPAKFRSSCKIDITYFPFDDQICELKFGSWTYDGFQVDITNRSAKVDLDNYVFSGEWELIDVRVKRTEMYYACCKQPYPDVRFTIIIRRKTLYYLFNIIFPCLWLTILSLLGFWLPPDSGEKITLGITVLLAFSVFMLLIAESMPATSEFVPLIGIYLTVTMAMTSLSIILTVFVLQLHHVGPHQKRVPRWMWTLVIEILAPLVCLCHVSQRYRYLGAKLSKLDRSIGGGGGGGGSSYHHPNTTTSGGSSSNSNNNNTGGRQDELRLSTLSAETTLHGAGGRRGGGRGGRGRGNCNGIIISRGGPSTAGGSQGDGGGGSGYVGGGSVVGDDGGGGLSKVLTRGRGGGGGSSGGRPHSEGGLSSPATSAAAAHSTGRASGSCGSVAAPSLRPPSSSSSPSSQPQPQPSAHHSIDFADGGGSRVSRGSELSFAAHAPARRDPQWRPGEYIGSVGGSRGPEGESLPLIPADAASAASASARALRGRALAAADSSPRGPADRPGGSALAAADSSPRGPADRPGGSAARAGSAVRDSDPDCDRRSAPVAAPSRVDLSRGPAYQPGDVTSPVEGQGTGGGGGGGDCDSTASLKGFPLRTQLPPEKVSAKSNGAGTTAPPSSSSSSQHVIRGQAPPMYRAQNHKRDLHATSGSAGQGQNYQPAAGGPAGWDVHSDRITQHLQVLVSRDDEDEYHQDVVTEWRVVAHVMDRLLFWLFLLVAIVSSVIILIIKPLTKPETWRNTD